MKLLFQHASDSPSDWVELDSTDWQSVGPIDINALCVQGDIWEGPDIYGVRDLPNGGLEIAGICDSDDWPVGQRWCRVVTYSPLMPDPRPEYGRAYNSVKTSRIYADNQELFSGLYGDDVQVLPYNPGLSNRFGTRKGKWLPDNQFDALVSARHMPDWRTWTEGVPTEDVKNGVIRDQASAGRKVKPKGTQTRILSSGTASSATAHSAENATRRLSRSIGTETTLSEISITDHEVFFFVSIDQVASDPAWNNTGVYRCQLDASAASSDLIFGLLNVGSSTGHFCRLGPRGDTCLQSIQQDQSAFSGAGLHLASITNPSWSSGAVSDTMGCLVAGYRTAGHTKQTLTLRVNRFDDYMNGPWKTLPLPVFFSHVMGV